MPEMDIMRASGWRGAACRTGLFAGRRPVRLLGLLCLLLEGLASSACSWGRPPVSGPELFREECVKGASDLRVLFSPTGKTLALAGAFSCNSWDMWGGLILWDLEQDSKQVI